MRCILKGRLTFKGGLQSDKYGNSNFHQIRTFQFLILNFKIDFFIKSPSIIFSDANFKIYFSFAFSFVLFDILSVCFQSLFLCIPVLNIFFVFFSLMTFSFHLTCEWQLTLVTSVIFRYHYVTLNYIATLLSFFADSSFFTICFVKYRNI